MKERHSTDITKWLLLRHADGVGPITFSKIMHFLGHIDLALGASVSQLTKIDGIGTKTAEKIARTRNRFDVQAELQLAEKLGVNIIHLHDPRYPVLLKKIDDPPPVLYIKGTIDRRDNLAVSIVGSRHPSLYGNEQAGRFAHFLAASGFTICSGMARGIDSAAHQGALSAGGRTIAVQGCGLANIFPPENKRLFEYISQNGACVTELPLTYEPLSENFPARNRIIAGLSLGTIVIEAGLRSGALITARAAADYNREVMAIPGKIDSPLSRGPHYLIKEGARLVESIEDVTEALGYIGEKLQSHVTEQTDRAKEAMEQSLFETIKTNLTANEQAVLNCLDHEPLHIDQIITQSGLAAGDANATMVSLRLKGLIKQLPGSLFMRR